MILANLLQKTRDAWDMENTQYDEEGYSLFHKNGYMDAPTANGLYKEILAVVEAETDRIVLEILQGKNPKLNLKGAEVMQRIKQSHYKK